MLAHEKRIQARRFAGLDPKAHGASQERFDRLFARLEDLYRQAWSEGIPGKNGTGSPG